MIALVAVAPHKGFLGFDPVNFEKQKPGWKPAPKYRVTELLAALAAEYQTDAHLVCYVCDDRKPGKLQARLNKGGLALARDSGMKSARVRVLGADVDNIDHRAWASDEEACTEARRVKALVPTAIVYVTEHGLRVLQEMTESLDVEEHEPVLETWLEGLAALGVAAPWGDGALKMLLQCRDWTRHFRLPNVMRKEKGDAPAYRYRSPLVLTDGATPIAPPPPAPPKEIPRAATSDAGSAERSADPSRMARARAYLATIPPAIAGKIAVGGRHTGGTATFYVCVRIVKGFALTDDATFEVMAPWAARCEPPWEEHGSQGLRRKIAEAADKGDLPWGALLGDRRNDAPEYNGDPLIAFAIAVNAAFILARVETDPATAFADDMIALVAALSAGGVDEQRVRAWLKNLRPPVLVGTFDARVADARRKHVREERREREPDWKAALVRDKEGETKHQLSNLITMLTGDPAWRGVLRFNEFANRIELAKPPPWHDEAGTAKPWTDEDDVRLLMHTERVIGLHLTATQCRSAALNAAQRDRFNPLTDWLSSLTWDDVPRVERLASMYLGAEENDYTRNVSRWFMIDAVRRAFEPGCKADHMIVLEGPQGEKKSTALRTLAGDEYFSDTELDLASKDRFIQLNGVWLYELAELDNLNRHDVARIKSYLSSAADIYRPPYARDAVKVPRRCLFVGSVNPEKYLRDPTGNRRFWPLKCGAINIDTLKAHRGRLWAEAVQLYRAGTTSWPTTDTLRRLVAEEQGERVEVDPWEAKIGEWLASPPYDPNAKPPQPYRGPADPNAVTIAEVLEYALEMKPGAWKQTDQNRVAASLKGLGFRVRQVRQGAARMKVYEREPVTGVTGAESETGDTESA